MNMVEAAKQTVREAYQKGYDDLTNSDIPSLDYPHISEMVSKMENEPMSEGKKGRWLGWIQAACVVGTDGELSLEDCKRINKCWSEG